MDQPTTMVSVTLTEGGVGGGTGSVGTPWRHADRHPCWNSSRVLDVGVFYGRTTLEVLS